MRIAIQTLGTRGDVQPYVALARGLVAAGHEVDLATATQFEGFVRDQGIGFSPLPPELLELMDTPEGKAAMSGKKSFRAGLDMLRRVKPIMRRLLDAQWQAARDFGPELILHHPKALGAPHIAERLGIQAMLSAPLPGFTPTRAFASPLMPFADLGPFNRISHRAAIMAADAAFAGLIKAWRAEALQLPGRGAGRRPLATVYAYSPSVVPVPDDWGPDVFVSGYWFLGGETGWTMPTDLADFLSAGPPPVYVGFGSIPTEDAARTTRIVVEALSRANQRAVLATGWGGLVSENLPPQVHAIEGAPHDRLFPLMSAIVHHGGAGTTAASLRAGKPTVVCPFFGDQPFWGRRVAALGAGPAPIPQARFTAENLAEAIGVAVGDAGMRARAEALGKAIAAERGVETAVAFIEERGRTR